MNYRPMFEFTSGERLGNAEAYATKAAALASAKARFMVWTMPTGYDTDETDDPVNYRWDDETGRVRLADQEVV
jgi:hypothetical protein